MVGSSSYCIYMCMFYTLLFFLSLYIACACEDERERCYGDVNTCGKSCND